MHFQFRPALVKMKRGKYSKEIEQESGGGNWRETDLVALGLGALLEMRR